jgi:2-dehydropantoate 2-reductase
VKAFDLDGLRSTLRRAPDAERLKSIGLSQVHIGHDALAQLPAIVASLRDGRLSSSILRRGMSTTVTDPVWAKVFKDAGIPATVHPDMESWLRTHAAVIVPLAIAGGIADRKGSGLSKSESVKLARAMDEGFRLVRHLGNSITPAPMAVVERMPVRALAALVWGLTRLGVFARTLAVAPADEPRMLIDEMSAAAPGRTSALQAVRPER